MFNISSKLLISEIFKELLPDNVISDEYKRYSFIKDLSKYGFKYAEI